MSLPFKSFWDCSLVLFSVRFSNPDPTEQTAGGIAGLLRSGILALLLLAPTAPSACAGFLFVSSTDTNVPAGTAPISQIMRYDSTTGAPIGTGVFVPNGSAGLSLPLGLAIGSNGNLFVASSGNYEILEFDGMTGTPVGNGVFVPSGSAGLYPTGGIAFGPNRNLFVANGAAVMEYDGKTGAPVGNGVFVSSLSAGLEAASGIAFGPNGNLFVSDAGDNRIMEFNGKTGAPIGNGVFVPAGSAGLSIPLGLTFGSNGNLFVSSEGSLRVLEYDSTTGTPVGTGQFVPDNSAGLRGPYGLAFGTNGNLFVSNGVTPQGGEAGNQILEYDGTSGAPVGNGVFVPQNSAGLSQPSFLAFSPAASPVPEPSSLSLACLGALGLLGYGWRRVRSRGSLPQL